MKNNEQFVFQGPSERLDYFLANSIDGYSRGTAKQLIKSGAVKVNGKAAARPALLLNEGDTVSLEKPADTSTGRELEPLIIYEDDAIIVVNKPSGLLMHPTSAVWEELPEAAFSGEKTLAGMLISCRPELRPPALSRAGLVHRLDRDTSGVLVIAKTPAVQKILSGFFKDRKADKIYAGIVAGSVKDESGVIDVPVGRITGGKIKASPLGRDAVTEYAVIGRKPDSTLLELRPKTGRTNQLRVHLAWLGHPVLGDTVYKSQPAPRLMLHSRKLTFAHPVSGKRVSFEAPLPEDFAKEWGSVKTRTPR